MRDGVRTTVDKKITVQSAHMQIRERAERVAYLFPRDCYDKQFANGHQTITHKGVRPLLQDEDDLDMVAKLENAALAGLDIPWEVTPTDLCMTFIPSRRALAFAYAVLRPGVGDNFNKAAKVARIPLGWSSVVMLRNLRLIQFLSAFWKERIMAMTGMTFIYANKHARRGSAPHLKILAEMQNLTSGDQSAPVNATQINFTIPDPRRKALPAAEAIEPDEFEVQPE